MTVTDRTAAPATAPAPASGPDRLPTAITRGTVMLAIANLIANMGIVLTGGAVRLGLAQEHGHPGGAEEGRGGGVHGHDGVLRPGRPAVAVPGGDGPGVDLAQQVQDQPAVRGLQPDGARRVGRHGAGGHWSSGVRRRVRLFTE